MLSTPPQTHIIYPAAEGELTFARVGPARSVSARSSPAWLVTQRAASVSPRGRRPVPNGPSSSKAATNSEYAMDDGPGATHRSDTIICQNPDNIIFLRQRFEVEA